MCWAKNINLFYFEFVYLLGSVGSKYLGQVVLSWVRNGRPNNFNASFEF